jgi:steroid 5-alpha reductase family enzyme
MQQGVFMYLIALPFILECGVGSTMNPALYGVGVLVFAVGFAFEAVGDAQLRAFVRDPANKGKIMTAGLWKYTRHPNYFGEATLWWGIFIIAMSCGVNPVAVVSPITITLLLLFVSGVPLLEKTMKNRNGYAEYAQKTSLFFPWFPKK